MDKIMNPDLLQYIFEFLTSEFIVNYSDLLPLRVVNKAFMYTVDRWPAFMMSVSIRMEHEGSAIVAAHRNRRHSRVAYGAMNVIRMAAGRLVHLKLGNITGNRVRRHVLTDRHLATIVDTSPRLRYIYIQMNNRFSTKGMTVLNKLPDIHSLELPLVRRIPWPTFPLVVKMVVAGSVSTRICTNLKHIQPSVQKLRLRQINGLIQNDFCELDHIFPNVMDLGMYKCNGVSITTAYPTHPEDNLLSRLMHLNHISSNVISSGVVTGPHVFTRIFPKVSYFASNYRIAMQARHTQCDCMYRENRNFSTFRRCAQCMASTYPRLESIVTVK